MPSDPTPDQNCFFTTCFLLVVVYLTSINAALSALPENVAFLVLWVAVLLNLALAARALTCHLHPNELQDHPFPNLFTRRDQIVLAVLSGLGFGVCLTMSFIYVNSCDQTSIDRLDSCYSLSFMRDLVWITSAFAQAFVLVAATLAWIRNTEKREEDIESGNPEPKT